MPRKFYENVIGIVSNLVLVVSPILTTIFAVLNKSVIKIKIIVLPWQYWRKREPAFRVDQLLILHVKSMFRKYERGVAACMMYYLVIIYPSCMHTCVFPPICCCYTKYCKTHRHRVGKTKFSLKTLLLVLHINLQWDEILFQYFSCCTWNCRRLFENKWV
jgi:hypothetical protein